MMQSILEEPNILKDQSILVMDLAQDFPEFNSDYNSNSHVQIPLLSLPTINTSR